jgi:hypothetical protein
VKKHAERDEERDIAAEWIGHGSGTNQQPATKLAELDNVRKRNPEKGIEDVIALPATMAFGSIQGLVIFVKHGKGVSWNGCG